MDFPQVGVCPQWLQILLGEKFFGPCVVHKSEKKNGKNSFCLDCCTSICLHCLPTHKPHRLLQIRRYVYHDVVRQCDAQKLMNCSLIQPYTTNCAKVVFIHQRPVSRPFKSNGNCCMGCHRNIQDSYIFCSLYCKVHHLGTSDSGSINEQTDKSLPGKTSSRLRSPELRDGKMGPDHLVLDLPVSLRTCCGSTSGSAANSGSVVSNGTLTCSATAAIESVEKKKRGTLLVSGISCQKRCSRINRRKSVPHRAPLN